jgi:hypothetical protein
MGNLVSRLLRKGKGKGKGKKKYQDHSEGSPSDSRDGSLENAPDTSSRKRTPEPTIARPSGRQRAREAAIIFLEFGSIISEATDLLKPMKVACSFMKKVLEVAKVSISPLARPLAGLITISLFANSIQNVEQVDQDWKGLINRLKFHIMTIQSQTKSLEEDQSMDESPPPFDLGIKKPLHDYVE